LAGGAIVGFIAGVADALDFRSAARAGKLIASVNGHAFAEGGNFFWEFAGGFNAQPISPSSEAGANGFEEALDFGDGEFLRERERRKFGFPEDFVGVGVADAAEVVGIGEGTLEGVVGGEQSGGELFGRGVENFEAAGIERAQTSFARDDVQRGALLGTGLGPEQRTVGKIEGGETARRRNFGATGLCAERVPVKTTGDHQMKDEPKISLETDADSLSHAAELQHLFAGGFGEGRDCGAQEKRANNANSFERLAEDATFERFDVNSDVRKFGHVVSLLMSQNGARTILQRQRDSCGHDGPKAKVVRSRAHNRLCKLEKIGQRLAGWPAKVFRNEATRKTAYTKIVQKYS
jgi:hypothetical protein